MRKKVNFIQLFTDESFCAELSLKGSRVCSDVSVTCIDAPAFFSSKPTFLSGNYYFIDEQTLNSYFDDLSQLSIFNEVVYVYKDEEELISNQLLIKIFAHAVPYCLTYPQLFFLWQSYGSNTTIENKEFSSAVHLSQSSIKSNFFSEISEFENSRVFIKNKNLQYCFCNNRFSNELQLKTIDDLQKSTGSDLWGPNAAFFMEEQDKMIFSGNKAIRDQLIEVNIAGERKQIKIDKYPLRDRNDQAWFILGIYTVAGEENQINEEPFPDWRLLQILMDNITDTIYFKDVESHFIRVNKAQANLIGIKSPEEAIGKTDFDYFNIEHSQKAFSDEKRIIHDKKPINNIEYIGTKNGKYQWVSASKVPIINKEGDVIGIVGITRNIDKIISVEHRLKAERDLLQLLIDHIPSPIYFKDTESKFTRVNLAQAKILGGQAVAEVLGKSDFDFYSHDNAFEFFNDERRIMETGKPMMNKIEACYPPGEGLRWFSATKIPIRNEEGELTGIVGVSHDITDQILVKQDLERAKEKAEVASTAKSNFLSNMSHEIRTPMNGVIGMAEVLSMTDLSDEQKKIVDLIIRSGNNLLNIINDILDFSKIENGKMQIEDTPINVKSIIREVFDMFIFSAAEKNIKYHHKIDPNIPENVIGDSLRLKQILINLISNAIKFTKTGEVIIEVDFLGNTDDTHCMIFKVTDTGIGIDIREKQSLFEAFTQADGSASRRYGGTGLGLAISSRLVKMMGGNLDVISEKGKGSTFFFDICFKKIVYDDSDSI